MLFAKTTLNESDKVVDFIWNITHESYKSFDKPVWFIINENYGKYYITMYYDNEHNKANGEVITSRKVFE